MPRTGISLAVFSTGAVSAPARGNDFARLPPDKDDDGNQRDCDGHDARRELAGAESARAEDLYKVPMAS